MQKNKGITLVALVITIIILLILAGVAINLTIGDNGIFKRAEESVEIHEEAAAREKLELVLDALLLDKLKDSKYNKNEYVDNRLREEGMTVNGDIVTVDGWQFEIDRDKLIIKKSLGKGEGGEEPEPPEPEEMPDAEGIIEFINLRWENGKASIDITSTNTEYQIQYQKNGEEEGKWEEGTEVSNYNIPIDVDTIKEGYPILCA